MKHNYIEDIRPVARNTLASLVSAPRFGRRHLAVSGLPRSGTSWLAKALSLAPRVAYNFEPDHVLDNDCWYMYLPWQFHRTGWVLKGHDLYCMQAQQRIGWLAGEMGLGVSDEMMAFINCRSPEVSGPGYGVARDPKTEIHKREKKISSQELHELAQMAKRFSLPFYPDLNPEAFLGENA